MSTQPHFLGSMTLKALLEDPNFKNPPTIGQSNPNKVKKDEGSDVPQYNYGSAFLGPALWDKSYDTDLNLEYMDLDEFLSENNIPTAEEDVLGVNSPQQPLVSSPRQYLRTPPLSPSDYLKGTTTTTTTVASPSYPPQSPPGPEVSSSTPSSPGSPLKIDFQVSDQDLALTTIPDYKDPRYYQQGWIRGGDDPRPNLGVAFDPRKRNFTDEELKPQPIIKKSKKIFVPDDLKDEKYWARRLKNNYAAKRSRDARRVKENQIALRAAYLEKENKCLKDEMSKLKKENAKLKSIVEKYEPASLPALVESELTWPSLSP